MNEYITPNKCEESKNFGNGIYVCKIELAPCNVIRGRECAKLKYQRTIESIKDILLEAENE